MRDKKDKRIFTLKILLCTGIIFSFLIFSNHGHKNINSLLNELARGINNVNENQIIDCYPDFIQKSLPNISHQSIEKFHNNIGDVSFKIVHKNKCNSNEVLTIQNEINSKYEENIKLDGCVILICEFHHEFGEGIYELIQINGNWYLYYGGRLPDPLENFVE